MGGKNKNVQGEGKWTEGLPIHLDGWLRALPSRTSGQISSSAALAMVFE